MPDCTQIVFRGIGSSHNEKRGIFRSEKKSSLQSLAWQPFKLAVEIFLAGNLRGCKKGESLEREMWIISRVIIQFWLLSFSHFSGVAKEL